MRIPALPFALAALAFISVCHSAEAQRGSPDFHPSPDLPVGWRGDDSGRYPAATPPLEWYRRPKGAFNAIRVQATRPKGAGPEGEPLNMGTIREWLITAPFEAKDHATALDDVTHPNELALSPTAGEDLAGKAWSVHRISVGNQSQSAGKLQLDFAMINGVQDKQEAQNRPGTMEPRVAYAHVYVYSPEAGKALLQLGGSHLAGWFNGKPVKIPKQYEAAPTVELNAGWNRLLVKAATTKASWNVHSLITPVPGTGYETKNIQWMAPMPGLSWSSPIIVGSKIFVAADEGTLVCLNKADGRALWTRSTTYYHLINDEERKKFPTLAPKIQQLDAMMKTLPDALNAGLSVDGSKAEGNKDLQNKIKQKIELERAIRQTMGKADKLYNAWDNDRSWSMPTPASDGKNVFAVFYGGNKGIGANAVVCFDLDGNTIWSHFTGQTGIGEHGTHASPVLSGSYLVYMSGATLFCYEKATGKVVWQKKSKFGGVAGASPVATKAGTVDVVLFPEVGIYRTSDGVELWKSDVTHSIVTPSLVNGVLYGVGEGNVVKLYAMTIPALSGDTVKPDFVFKKPWKEVGLNLPGAFSNSLIGPPLIHDGLEYIVTEGGGFAVLDAKTGAPVYTKLLESLNPRLTWVFTVGLCTGPTLAGNVIHIRDDQSQTLVLAPGRDYKELAKNVIWEIQTNGAQQETQSTPIYEGPRMYYRTHSYLYCIGEK